MIFKGSRRPKPSARTRELGSGVVEHLADLGGKGGDDGRVEEGVETRENYAANDNADDDLDTGVDVALGSLVLDGNLCGNDCAVELALDVVEKFLHTVFFLSFVKCFV